MCIKHVCQKLHMTANHSKIYPGPPLNIMSKKPNLNCSTLNQNIAETDPQQIGTAVSHAWPAVTGNGLSKAVMHAVRKHNVPVFVAN